MGITFRHDAAAVALPANSASRKYGQQLVLQQQQQKYNAQQAGYDRLLQLGRDQQQNVFQAGRDQAQQAFIQGRDNAQNQFQMGRDKALFDQQQQMQQAEQQRKFMEDARKQSSGMIMDGIKNGEYDPATARKLQQNLVEESEALGNPGLDATQRAEALAKLRAERALLSSNRIQKPPTPTPQEQFEQSVITDPQTGMRYIPNAKGGLEPLPESKQQQQMRPKSFQDYYGENEDKFQKDLDATMKSMETTNPKTGAVTTPTQDEALAQMQKDYDFRQKALGRPTYGTPTEAPSQPGAAPVAPGQSQSILEQPATPGQPSGSSLDEKRKMVLKGLDNQAKIAGADPELARKNHEAMVYGMSEEELTAQAKRWSDQNGGDAMSGFAGEEFQAMFNGAAPQPATPVPRGAQPMAATTQAQRPDPGMPPAPSGWSTMTREQKQAELTRLGASPQEIANDDASLDRSYAFHSQPIGTAQAPAASSQNPWAEVAKPAQASKTTTPPAQAPQSIDFGVMASGAKNDADRAFINKMQEVHKGQSPDVQAAIGVLLSPDSLDRDAAQALMYLKSKGIDVEQLMATQKSDDMVYPATGLM